MKLLMCQPSYFGVAYEINPWMSRGRPTDRQRAARQWHSLYSVLSNRIGAHVELVQPVRGLPDLVFTANAGLVEGDLVVRSNFRFPQRAAQNIQQAILFGPGAETLLTRNANLKPGKPLELKAVPVRFTLGVWGRKRSQFGPDEGSR